MSIRIIESASVLQPLGKTRHFRGGADVSHLIRRVAIAQIGSDPGFYLYYYDADGKQLNDTYHATVAKAREQAAFEFGLREGDWVRVG